MGFSLFYENNTQHASNLNKVSCWIITERKSDSAINAENLYKVISSAVLMN